MRTAITRSCSSRVLRSMAATDSRSFGRQSGVNFSTICAVITCAITSSPTRSISRSTFSVATRIEVDSLPGRAGVARAFATGADPPGGAAGASARTPCAGAISSTDALAAGSILRIEISARCSTNSNTSRNSSSDRLLAISIVQPSQQCSGSSSASGGRFSA